MKKLFGLLACLLLALGLVPSSAFATGNATDKATENTASRTTGEVVEVTGEHTYESLAEIFSNAPEGAVVTFRNDVTYTVKEGLLPIPIKKSLTIDLGGHTLTGQGGSMLDIYSDVTITNGTIALEGASSNAAVWLNQTAKLTVAADVHFNVTGSPENAASAAINFYSDCAGAVLDFSGSIDGDMGLSVNGNITANNTIIIRDGVKITAKTTGLYQAGFATTTIGKAEITGATGIEVRAGNVTLNGTQITATSDFKEVPNSGGTTISGAALAVSQHTTNQPINVTVNDSTLTGVKAFYEADLQDADGAGTDQITLNLASGHYHGVVESANKTAFINGGVFTVQPEADLVAPAKTEASVTTDGTTTYFIGEPAYVASEIAAVAQAGSSVEVTQGDLALENIPAEVTVKNSGDGAVSVNHIVVPTGESVTTVVKTDSEGISPQTGDLSLITILALMAGALLAFVAAYRSQKVRA